MPDKVRELRGLIYKQYDSEAEFAKKIGWNRQKLNRITNGTRTPSIDEVHVIAKQLGVDFEKIAQFFLTEK